MWISITDFGDSAVGLTLAALVMLALFASGWRRGALAWLLAVAGCGTAMAMLKLAFKVAAGGCVPVAVAVPAFSPSGHAALSTVVYGGMAVLGWRQLAPTARWLLGVAAALFIVLIAGSRIAVQAHTPFEVLGGLSIGLASVALMVRLLRRTEGPRVLLPQFAVALALALALMYGSHWQIESGLHELAAWLRGAAGACAR
jgi:membrane-associated phospholipid phosphatase